MKSNFNVQFATQRLREEEIEETNPVDKDTRDRAITLNRYITNLESIIVGLGESNLRNTLLKLTSKLDNAVSANNSSEILDILNEILENLGSIDRISRRDIETIIQKIKEVYSLGEQSATGAEGAYLTKLKENKKSLKPTSGYKEVKGFRPGHSKLKIVQTKDLWNLNEAVATKDKENIKSILQLVKGDSELHRTFIGMMSEPYPHGYDEFYNMLPTDKQLQAPKPEELSQSDATWSQKIKSFFGKRPQQEDLADSNEPPKVINYPNGEKVEVGQKIKINNKQIKDGYGVVTGFDNQTILVRVDRDNRSSQPRQDIPVDISDIEQMDSEKKDEPLQEGIRTEIKQRNKSQQFHEATKMVNKKLREINNILEYAEQLKGDLDESARPNHLMEKMKRGMVSAYKKMREL